MSNYKLLSPEANRSILVARELQINTDNIYHYFLFLDNLKQYQLRHLPEQVGLLDFFYDLSVYQLIHEKNYIDGTNNPLLTLMQDLSKLKDAIPKDQESWLYAPSRDALLQAIRLTKDIIKVLPRKSMDARKVNFQERINTVSQAVNAATAVVLDPFSFQKQDTLYRNVYEMRRRQEGKYELRAHDEPQVEAFVAALVLVCSVALMVMSAFIIQAFPILAIATAYFAAAQIDFSIRRMMMVSDPWTFQRPKEKRVSEQSVQTGAAMDKLAERPASFFYSNDKTAKAVSYPEVELQPRELRTHLWR